MLKAKHRTGLVFFPAFDWAISPTHPEREERLLYTQDQVFEEGLFDIDGVTELKPDPVTLKDIVMPILKDFKPDLIINSAGQDNHYSDPITNMNFSAQGYADLTAMLEPDIAVLEGGYSIEGALPYVNVGIILAMAGVDYGKVKEPDYHPESIRQTQSVTDAIERIGDVTHTIWQERENIKAQLMENPTPQRRTRNIYYDTDRIRESQSEQIQICPDCAGALRIDSTSDRGMHILAVHIPRKACSKCKEIGYRWHDTADTGQFDMIFLQDRTEDKYLEGKL